MGSGYAHVFVYGTLADDTLVSELIGRRLLKESGILRGYRKVVPPRGYVYIVPAPGETVAGFVLRDVDEEALRAFDRYEDEGRLYRRTQVSVVVSGREERVMTYVGIADALTSL